MPGLATGARASKPSYAACTGCSLCLLVCPVWRKTRDLRYTPHGRAKALQHGVPASELAGSIESCTLCGACEPACPENIALVELVLDLRRQLPPMAPVAIGARTATHAADYVDQNVILAGRALRENERARKATVMLLGCTPAADNGDDIALALEAGHATPAARLDEFLAPLRAATSLIVADGLLARQIKTWLPLMKFTTLGVELSSRRDLRRRLRADDLYVIEPRAFHADYARLVRHYDELRHETGCAMNLDLQRIAIPATARTLRQRLGLDAADDAGQTRWLLQGRSIARIVVEDAGDIAAFNEICDLPVVHLAELANG
jgi:heterodisulfide reductase subunit C